ncbi:MAG: thioesterase family protein [Myxococcota bacterium]
MSGPSTDAFTHRQIIALSQVDAAGILYFARLFEICHLAFEHWLIDEGLPLLAGLGESDELMPIVHAEADYRSPLRLGHVIDVAVQVEATGQSSITFGFRVTTQGRLAAVARHVHVAIDKADFRSRPLPDAILGLAKGEQP